MSDSPLNKNPQREGMPNNSNTADTPSQTSDNVQFKAKDIGRWASMQENPFAEQNRKTAERNRETAKKRLKATPAVVAIVSIIAVGLGLWGLVSLVIHIVNNWPQEETVGEVIEGNSQEDINKYRELLQNLYSQSGKDIQSVQDTVNSTLGTQSGQQYPEAVKIAESTFYAANGYFQETIDVAESIDYNALTDEQKLMYSQNLYYVYSALGDQDKVDEYSAQVYELVERLGGGEGD